MATDKTLDSYWNEYQSAINTVNTRLNAIADSTRQQRISDDFGNHTFFTYPQNTVMGVGTLLKSINNLISNVPETDRNNYQYREDENLMSDIYKDYQSLYINMRKQNKNLDAELFNRIQNNGNASYFNDDYRRYFSLVGDNLKINTGEGIAAPQYMVDVLANSIYDVMSDNAYSTYQKKTSDYKQYLAEQAAKAKKEAEEQSQRKKLESNRVKMSGTASVADSGRAERKNSTPILGGGGFNFGGMQLGFNDLLGGQDKGLF